MLNAIWDNFDSGDAHTNCLNDGDFVKSGAVRFVRYLRGQMCLCPECLYLFFSLGTICEFRGSRSNEGRNYLCR